MRLAELRGDVVILACAVSAGIHAALVPEHFAEGTGAGVGFARRGRPARPRSPSGSRASRRIRGCSSARRSSSSVCSLSYALAVTTGVPVLHPEPEAVDGLALGTKAIELVGLLAAASVLSRPRLVGRPIPLLLTALVAVFSGLSAVAVSGGHHRALALVGGGEPCAPSCVRNRQVCPSSRGGWSSSWRAVSRAGSRDESRTRRRYDLHALIELVESGCPPELAVRILAP